VRFRLACLPVIALAGNFHSGAIFAAAVVVCHCLQEAWLRRRPLELVVAAAAVACLCLNPGGPFDLASMIFHLDVQKIVVIQEYLPPVLRGEPVFFVLLPLVLIGAFRQRASSPATLLLLLLFGVLGLRSRRMVYEFQLLAVPVLVHLGLSLRRRLGNGAWGAAALAFTLVCGASHRWDLRVASGDYGPVWDERALPVRAAAFVRSHGLDGPYFNAYDDGGYVEWALPGLPAFVDGRIQCFPRDFFHRFYEAGHSPAQFRAFLRAEGAQWALVSRDSPWLGGRGLLDASPDWALVYWDEHSQLFLRRDQPRFATLISTDEYQQFHPSGPVIGAVATTPPALLGRFLAEVSRYQTTAPNDPMAAVVRCALRVRAGQSEAAQECGRARELVVDEAQRALLELALRVPVATP
jgi:hypothetical protein